MSDTETRGSLRERIMATINTHIYADPDPDGTRWYVHNDHYAADAILTLFREALTSDAAVEAAVDAHFPFPYIQRDELKADMCRTLTAAFDAITNGADDVAN